MSTTLTKTISDVASTVYKKEMCVGFHCEGDVLFGESRPSGQRVIVEFYALMFELARITLLATFLFFFWCLKSG